MRAADAAAAVIGSVTALQQKTRRAASATASFHVETPRPRYPGVPDGGSKVAERSRRTEVPRIERIRVTSDEGSRGWPIFRRGVPSSRNGWLRVASESAK